MKTKGYDPIQLAKERKEKKEREIERCWEVWERHRDKLYWMEAKNVKEKEGK